MTTRTPKPSEIRPHDGSVLSGAIHLKLTDELIRQRLKDMRDSNALAWENLQNNVCLAGGGGAWNDLVASDKPIPHPLRVMLCTIFDIECILTDKV